MTAEVTAPPKPSTAAEPDPARAPIPEPNDPVEFLYARRLSFEGGVPLVSVRIAEGQREIALVPQGSMHVAPRRGASVDAPAGGEWRIKLLSGAPGVFRATALVEEFRYADHDGAWAAQRTWTERGYDARLTTVGAAYGIAGRVVDTRRMLIVLRGDGSEASARALADDAERRFAVRPEINREMIQRPSGHLALVSPSGAPVLEGEDAFTLTIEGDAGARVRQVEFGTGYAFHGFEDRIYAGKLIAVVDAHGTLALVDALPLERLAAGIVPSEIFATSPAEALKAQAVTARGEILAKIGARHLGDPYSLCAEQHCQVYKGLASELPAPSAAVAATRGEALFAKSGRLVDSVYSAVCGGYTEDNDVVWGGPPDPSLRGKPDFDAHDALADAAGGVNESTLHRFLASDPGAFCMASGFARPNKFRWERHFSETELDALVAGLGVGHVIALRVPRRGLSGRARALVIEGDKGSARVGPELPIRRLLKNLNSAMFEVEHPAGEWVFRGGGWGHGVGMCQTGAIGRALRGDDYKTILKYYFSDAQVARIY